MSDFSTIVARVIDSCQKQKQNSGTTHTSSAMVQRHARHHLRVAKAECSRSWSTPSGGLPSMPIGIRGVYHGVDAGDNLPTPPAQPETT